ncbi:MAG: cytochrome c3 family protein [bacterium]
MNARAIVFLIAFELAFALVIALAFAGPVAAQEESAEHAGAASSCVTCHLLDDAELGEPARLWTNDVHAEAGLGCHSCHGGDPTIEEKEDAMSPAKGYAPAPDRLHIADFCARCHADADFMKRYNPQARIDQLAEYRTSVHGKKNAEGDSIPATCTDCHSAHGIRPVSSPESPVYAANVPKTCARCHADAALMAAYEIPTDQFANYSKSVHAAALLERGDVAAPACNDCHGNHGATPPGVQSVANVCGQCHGREAMLFNASFKKTLFEESDVGECTVCHDHHLIHHPTPELFHGKSAPSVSQGRVVESAPFAADLGAIAAGASAQASWRVVVKPHIASEDARLAHAVEIAADGDVPIVIDATVRPGADFASGESARRGAAGAITAALAITPLSGTPVEAGDAILFELTVSATAAVSAVWVRDGVSEGVTPVAGSACLNCHTEGDSCDVASEQMYAALTSLDREVRESAALLHKAEVAGMEVSEPLFELKSKGVSAAVEARALIHAFDPDRLVKRTDEGKTVAAGALAAARGALAELQNRRKGLAVSLVLVACVLVLLSAKIRQVDRARRDAAGDGAH